MRLGFAQGALPVLASAVLLAGCSSTAPTTSVTPVPAVHEKHWGYVTDAETAGPAEWGSLSGDAACAAGRRQSPIDLATRIPFPVEAKDLPNLVFKYGTTRLHLVNNGHTVQADVDKGSTVEIDGAAWTLVQLHFHAPSEHSLDGLHYPMEMHLVHAGPDGKPGLVVGVFLVQGGNNPAFTPLLSDLPKEKRRAKGRRVRDGRPCEAAAREPDVPRVRRLVHDSPLHGGHPVVRAPEPDGHHGRAAGRFRLATPHDPFQPSRAAPRGPQGSSRHDTLSARALDTIDLEVDMKLSFHRLTLVALLALARRRDSRLGPERARHVGADALRRRHVRPADLPGRHDDGRRRQRGHLRRPPCLQPDARVRRRVRVRPHVLEPQRDELQGHPPAAPARSATSRRTRSSSTACGTGARRAPAATSSSAPASCR